MAWRSGAGYLNRGRKPFTWQDITDLPSKKILYFIVLLTSGTAANAGIKDTDTRNTIDGIRFAR